MLNQPCVPRINLTWSLLYNGYITYIDFHMLNQPCVPRINLTWSLLYNPFYLFLGKVYYYFATYLYIMYIGLSFSFLAKSLSE